MKFARQCSITKQGMNSGWCFGDGEEYAKDEADALQIANEWGYKSLEQAYDDNACYWTEWEDETDFQYELVNGVLVEIDD
jgi:hypothetical protein